MVYKQTQEFSNNEPLVKSRGITNTGIDKLTSTNTDDVDSLALFTQRQWEWKTGEAVRETAGWFLTKLKSNAIIT